MSDKQVYYADTEQTCGMFPVNDGRFLVISCRYRQEMTNFA